MTPSSWRRVKLERKKLKCNPGSCYPLAGYIDQTYSQIMQTITKLLIEEMSGQIGTYHDATDKLGGPHKSDRGLLILQLVICGFQLDMGSVC